MLRMARLALGWATGIVSLAAAILVAEALGEFPWLVLAAIVIAAGWAEVIRRESNTPWTPDRSSKDLQAKRERMWLWNGFWHIPWWFGDGAHRAGNAVASLVVPGFRLTSALSDEGERVWHMQGDGNVAYFLILLIRISKWLIPLAVTLFAQQTLADLKEAATNREERALSEQRH